MITQQEFLERLDRKAPLARTEIEAVQVRHQTFESAFDLSSATFLGPLQFMNCEFRGDMSLMGATLASGAQFFDCTFFGKANFAWATFNDCCYLWRSHFLGPASFDNCVVQARNDISCDPRLSPGEANFSWAYFGDAASFLRMKFKGPAWFWRTVFEGAASFEEAKFEGPVHFYGEEHEVCIGESDLANPALFRHLLQEHVLTPDSETSPPRYGQFQPAESELALVKQLAGHGLRDSDVKALQAFWKQHARSAFPRNKPTSFQSVTFASPTQTEFRQVNLGLCKFSGTEVERVVFSNVTWNHRPIFPLMTRTAVWDEDEASSPNACAAVHRLYGQLKDSYEAREMHREASDFRYGEMEMLRTMDPRIVRSISIVAIYKYLSGYGERYGLALLLLFAFVFLVFPVLYLVLGADDDALQATLRSLEVSTFLPAAERESIDTKTRFIEGFERLVVPLQAGMFVLAVNRRLGRK